MNVFTTIYNYLSAVGTAFAQDVRLTASGSWLNRGRGLGNDVHNRRRVPNRASNPGHSNNANRTRHLEDPHLVGEEAAARARRARLARESASGIFLGPIHTGSTHTEAPHTGPAHAEQAHIGIKRARADDAENDQVQPPRPYKKPYRAHAASNTPVDGLRISSGAARPADCSIGMRKARAHDAENGQTQPVRVPKNPCRDHTGSDEQPYISAFDRNKARYTVKLTNRPRSRLPKRKRDQSELSNTESHEAREAKRLRLQLQVAHREATQLKNRVFEVCQENHFLREKCQYLQDQLKKGNKTTQKKVTFDFPEEATSGES
ncbi:hypothetical protein DL771_009798 [Monosporascus sp. 5C6A]|nr:hypothetical protein DL771_009798 [Monosporascus sp. 5C6A]